MKNINHYQKIDTNGKRYHLHIDADTLLFSCAVVIDKEPCTVKHLKSGRSKTFDTFTDFIDFLTNDEKGKNFTVKDFDVKTLGFAFSNFNSSLKKVLDQQWIKDYTLYLGGSTNFRKELYPEYKGKRKKSPAMRKFLFDYVVWKYGDKVNVSVDAEAEDFCLAEAFADPSGLVVFVDKDLTTQSGLFYNYQKPEDGVFFITKEQAFYNLCCQLLHGDRSTDNIKGIDFVSPELKEKYKVSTKSVGEGTARNLLEDVDGDIDKLRERVIDVYKLSYKDKWKEALQFTGSLVYISPRKGEYFNVDTFTGGLNG